MAPPKHDHISDEQPRRQEAERLVEEKWTNTSGRRTGSEVGDRKGGGVSMFPHHRASCQSRAAVVRSKNNGGHEEQHSD